MSDNNILQPITLVADDNYVEYRLQEKDIVIYKTQVNHIEPKSGATIQNIAYPVNGYYIPLRNTFGDTLKCGNIITSFFTLLKSKVDNTLLIIDFQGVDEVSESFCSEYYKYLLTTKNKVITINQDINVSNIFADFILRNTQDIETQKTMETSNYPQYVFD